MNAVYRRVLTLAATLSATMLLAACAESQGLSAPTSAPASRTTPAIAKAATASKKLWLPGKPTLRFKGESFYLNVTKELLEHFIAKNKLAPLRSWPQTLSTGLPGYTAPPSLRDPSDRLQTAVVSTTFSVHNDYTAIYYNTKHRYLVIQP